MEVSAYGLITKSNLKARRLLKPQDVVVRTSWESKDVKAQNSNGHWNDGKCHVVHFHVQPLLKYRRNFEVFMSRTLKLALI